MQRLMDCKIIIMNYPFKWQAQKMIKHTQKIRREQATNCLSVFDYFVGLRFQLIVENRSS